MRSKAPLLAPIFRSDAQARLLSALLLAGDELSLTRLANLAGVPYGNTHREVERLLSAGILRDRREGRTRLISANPDSPLTPPLREILSIVTGPVVLLQQGLADVPGVEIAFLYGSFAARMRGVEGPAPNDIDLMVVGTVDADAVYDVCERVSETVGRTVNPTILTREELDEHSGFLDTVRSRPVVPIIGEPPWL